MPSEEEIRAARRQEREDGWGILDGVSESDWVDFNCIKPHDESLLESGQKLKHHTKAECTGNCCLHGTSPYASCKMPRLWRGDKGAIEHQCPHGIGHPCKAGTDYAEMMGQHHDGGVHGCDGCCRTIAEDRLAKVEYSLLQDDYDIEMLTESLTHCESQVYYLNRRVTALMWAFLLVTATVGVLAYMIK